MIFVSQTPVWRRFRRKIGLERIEHDQDAPGSGA